MLKKILIIDDEKNICDLVKKGLEKMGDFNVSTATNGKDGIQEAKRVTPALIILDIRMPGIDGIEVLRRLKSDDSTMAIPVIMLTGVREDSAKEQCANEYNELYLEKPIELEVLKAKIEEVLKRSGRAY